MFQEGGACKKQTAKKYTTRGSPPFSAQDCKGETKKGNDGKDYKSVPDMRGIYRWIKATASTKATRKMKGIKTYEIHDNRGRPFVAEDHKKSLIVYSQTYDDVTDKYSRSKEVLNTPYTTLFVGTDPLHFSSMWQANFRGNSLLVHVKGSEYIFIGWKIFSFKTIGGEKISTYHSPVGNNDVPYPYALGEHYVYLFIEEVYVPKESIDLKRDPYAQYYGFDTKNKPVKDLANKLKVKIIHKRVF